MESAYSDAERVLRLANSPSDLRATCRILRGSLEHCGWLPYALLELLGDPKMQSLEDAVQTELVGSLREESVAKLIGNLRCLLRPSDEHGVIPAATHKGLASILQFCCRKELSAHVRVLTEELADSGLLARDCDLWMTVVRSVISRPANLVHLNTSKLFICPLDSAEPRHHLALLALHAELCRCYTPDNAKYLRVVLLILRRELTSRSTEHVVAMIAQLRVSYRFLELVSSDENAGFEVELALLLLFTGSPAADIGRLCDVDLIRPHVMNDIGWWILQNGHGDVASVVTRLFSFPQYFCVVQFIDNMLDPTIDITLAISILRLIDGAIPMYPVSLMLRWPCDSWLRKVTERVLTSPRNIILVGSLLLAIFCNHSLEARDHIARVVESLPTANGPLARRLKVLLLIQLCAHSPETKHAVDARMVIEGFPEESGTIYEDALLMEILKESETLRLSLFGDAYDYFVDAEGWEAAAYLTVAGAQMQGTITSESVLDAIQVCEDWRVSARAKARLCDVLVHADATDEHVRLWTVVNYLANATPEQFLMRRSALSTSQLLRHVGREAPLNTCCAAMSMCALVAKLSQPGEDESMPNDGLDIALYCLGLDEESSALPFPPSGSIYSPVLDILPPMLADEVTMSYEKTSPLALLVLAAVRLLNHCLQRKGDRVFARFGDAKGGQQIFVARVLNSLKSVLLAGCCLSQTLECYLTMITETSSLPDKLDSNVGAQMVNEILPSIDPHDPVMVEMLLGAMFRCTSITQGCEMVGKLHRWLSVATLPSTVLAACRAFFEKSTDPRTPLADWPLLLAAMFSHWSEVDESALMCLVVCRAILSVTGHLAKDLTAVAAANDPHRVALKRFTRRKLLVFETMNNLLNSIHHRVWTHSSEIQVASYFQGCVARFDRQLITLLDSTAIRECVALPVELASMKIVDEDGHAKRKSDVVPDDVPPAKRARNEYVALVSRREGERESFADLEDFIECDPDAVEHLVEHAGGLAMFLPLGPNRLARPLLPELLVRADLEMVGEWDEEKGGDAEGEELGEDGDEEGESDSSSW